MPIAKCWCSVGLDIRPEKILDSYNTLKNAVNKYLTKKCRGMKWKNN